MLVTHPSNQESPTHKFVKSSCASLFSMQQCGNVCKTNVCITDNSICINEKLFFSFCKNKFIYPTHHSHTQWIYHHIIVFMYSSNEVVWVHNIFSRMNFKEFQGDSSRKLINFTEIFVSVCLKSFSNFKQPHLTFYSSRFFVNVYCFVLLVGFLGVS